MNKYGRTQKAAEETIRICINEDVLADYLKEKEVEVLDIMTALFNEEEVSRRYQLRLKKEQAEIFAQKLLAKSQMSIEDIADCSGLSVSEVEKLAKLELA